MSYTKKTWSTGDTITAEALNNLESGASANASAIAEIEKELPSYVGADVPRKAAETITPGAANQTIAANQYLTGAQTIKGDGNLSAGNIKKGVSIFGVAGTLETGSTGTDTSDATAEAGDIVSGKTAYVNGEKVTGTLGTSTILQAKASKISESTVRPTTGVGSSYKEIAMRTASVTSTSGKRVINAESTEMRIFAEASEFGNATAADVAEGKTFTSAAGLKVKGTKAASSSLDTSDATAAASDILSGKTAYVNGSKVTGTISKKTSTTFIPGTSDQIISSGQYLAGAQTIKGDNNLVAENIKSGVSIFGVTGTLETGSTGTDTSDATATAGDILYGETAYVNGEKVTGTIQSIGARTITPSVNDREIQAGYYLKGAQIIKGDANLTAENIKKGVSIFGVPGTLETGTDTSDATATASDILSGKTAYVDGSKVTGTISSKSAATYTPGTSNQTIAAGRYLAGPQTIEGDSNLVAENIKSGVSIFGVAGTYAGSGGSGSGNNNCEAYVITSANTAVNFKNSSGTIKVYGYGTVKSQSSWGGGGSTSLLAFHGDHYYKSVSYGSPSSTALSLSINSDGTISGLPSMDACELLVVRGV